MDPKYPIIEKLLSQNRPGTPLKPSGFVIHSTADPGATAQNEHDYFNSGYRAASAHYFADWTHIIRTIPEDEIAWHAGPTANHRFLSVEMCEPVGNNPAKFATVWDRTVWLVADACLRYGWGVDSLWSHAMVSAKWHETDHTDPLEFMARYGKKWEDFVAAIGAEVEAMTPQGSEPDAWAKDAWEKVNKVGSKGVCTREMVVEMLDKAGVLDLYAKIKAALDRSQK